VGETWNPKDAAEVQAAVQDAVAQGRALELVGAGSRRGFGRPVTADVVLDLSALCGVVSYQPEELVVTLAPGVRLAELQALLATRRQQLAFEPPDLGPLWGLPAGRGTIGGMVMTGKGGPRRLTAGAPRDHCLGVKGVNGFGEAFAAGGRVVKNVTGFDLPKLVAGSFGTLCAVTELTLKVLPAPDDAATLVLLGLDDAAAIRAMSLALGSPAQAASAAHLPAEIAGASVLAGRIGAGVAATLLRLEGVTPSIAARRAHLAGMLEAAAPQILLDRDETQAVWKQVADVAVFAGDPDRPVWLISVPPAAGARVGARLAEELDGRCFYDWGGGGVWLEAPPAADAHAAHIRGVLAQAVGADGHATLIRAPGPVRSTMSPFQPLAPALAALTERVRAQFDPDRLFNPGRMGA